MPINKDLKAKLQSSNFTQIKDIDLIKHGAQFSMADYNNIPDSYIINCMVEKLKSTKINQLVGYDPFKYQEVIIGVTQFID